MFYATRHQVYYRFDTYGMTFASTLIWYYIHINTHNINHHSVHWGFNPTQKHRPPFLAKPPSLKSVNCPANCNAPWKKLPLPLFASNHLSKLRSCQALPFWCWKPSKIRTISFTDSYTKKCIRMLGKVNTCRLHTILIHDVVGPFYFGYLELGKKRKKR